MVRYGLDIDPEKFMVAQGNAANLCKRQVLGVLGRVSLAARLCSSCLPITSLGRDRPRRFILPMTALRVTPISRAVWPHERPAWRQRFSSSMRSEVQVAQFADMLIGLLRG
jgi:hypothetical protein